MNATFFVSPTAVAYVSVFLMHLVSLGYLLLRGPRSRQTWLFCGWLAGMTLMAATQGAACIIYGAPRVSGYLGWWGGVTGVTLAMIALIQFAYHFPRLRYPRESRVVLGISILFAGILFVWMFWEASTFAGYMIYATSPPFRADVFSFNATWTLYSFEGFVYGFAAARDAEPLVSFKLFDTWQIVGNTWILLVWLRKTVTYSETSSQQTFWRRAVRALRHPQGREALLARAWVLLMLLAPLPVLASIYEALGTLPSGTFAAIDSIVLFAIVLTYVNYAPEPPTFMVKLVGVSLVTILVILGLVSSYVMQLHRDAYVRMRQMEVRHVRTLVREGHLDLMPEDVLYVAARPAAGFFSSEYRMLFARPSAPDATALVSHDLLLGEGLTRGYFPVQLAVMHENPWLKERSDTIPEVSLLQIDRLQPPDYTVAYRGSSSYPSEHLMRYTFTQGDTRYEVGYSYLNYRRMLHYKSLPFVALITGVTLFILYVFPRFFHVGLVAPLMRLLDGVDRVNRGSLDVEVPVTIDDELGRLTGAFNRMVSSLRTSEEELRTLNLTLEQRVIDRTRDLAALYDVAALIIGTPDLEELLTQTLQNVVAAVGGAAGAVFLTPKNSAQLSRATHYGLSREAAAVVKGIPIWRDVREENLPLLIHDISVDIRVSALFPVTFPYLTLLGCPIRGKGGVLGVIVIFGVEALLFNVEDLGLVSAIAEQVGVAVENARLRERAEAAAVLEERQRLARDLHDSVTQLLYSQTLFADAGVKHLRAGTLERAELYIRRIGEAATQALREMRLLIYRLRPAALEKEGLVGALRRRLELVEMRARVTPHLSCDDFPLLPPAIEEELYFVSEEVLNNALKHAGATDVFVSLTCERGEIVLTIEDNGKGFDVGGTSPGLGLKSLHERASHLGALLQINSAPSTGTRVTLKLPIGQKPEVVSD